MLLILIIYVNQISSDVHSEVKDLYIQAARMQPHGTIDADVQNGLGILFNLSSEYDKAADCFRAALQVNPKVSVFILHIINLNQVIN